MIYLTLFIEFFKVGLFSFGGGFGMIPLIQDAVIRHNWMSEDAFYNFIGVCESTPGPIAVNMATMSDRRRQDFRAVSSLLSVSSRRPFSLYY